MKRSKIVGLKGKSPSSGYALLTVLLLLVLLFSLAAAIGKEVVDSQNATKTRLSSSAARYAAYAGIQHALVLSKTDSAFSGPLIAVLVPNSESVSYSVEVIKNSSLTASTAVDSDPPIQIPPGGIYIRSLGIDGNNKTIALHAVTGIYSQDSCTLNYAAFADNSLKLEGNSQSTSYLPGETLFTPTGAELTSAQAETAKGSLGTNRKLDLTDSAKIAGDIFIPSGLSSLLPDLTSHLFNPSLNTVTTLPSPVDMPRFSPPAIPANTSLTDITANGAGGILSSTPSGGQEVKSFKKLTVGPSGSLTVTSGSYYFTKGVSIEGSLNIQEVDSKPVIFFIKENMELANGSRVNFNGSGKSSNLQVYFINKAEGSQEFKMVGDSQFYGTVAGSRVNGIFEDNAQLYGSFLGRSVSAKGNAKLSYDESLKGQSLNAVPDWRLHGITEPKPKTLCAVSPVLRDYAESVVNQTVHYKKDLIASMPLAPIVPNE